MNRRWWFLLLLLFGLGFAPQPVQAETKAPRVLLAYDSLNAPAGKAARLTQLQQLLTAAGLRVHRQKIAAYHAGELASGHYAGVVTMINWDDAHLTNKAFTAERKAFVGIKLHIGGNLQQDELQGLHAQATPLYRRQLVATWPGQAGTQLLPYTTPVWVLNQTPKQAQNLGTLSIQGSNQQYPYATLVGRHGYLPYFDGRGQSELVGAEVVARLFKQTGTKAPLFVLTKVTPYTNLTRLRAVGRYLANQGIPFAVSATSVARNTELAAFAHYTAALRALMADGGVIFLQTPAVGDGLVGTQTLANDMTSTVTALAQRHVFAIGTSFTTYWNRDRLYRTQALSGMNTVIQLPDPAAQTYAKEDDQAQAFKTAFATVAATSLTTQRYGTMLARQQLDSRLPLGVTFAMPAGRRQWQDFKRQVRQFHGTWLNPQTLTTQYQVGMITLAYQQGQYLVNGRAATGEYHTPSALKLEKTPQTWADRFFADQSKVMWLFFAVAFSVMAVLLGIGRRVYVRMYRRPQPEKGGSHDDS